MDIYVTDSEAADVVVLLDELESRYSGADDPRLLERYAVYARDLPRRLTEEVEAWRLRERDAVCLVHGLPIANERLGATPAHWRDAAQQHRGVREEMLLVALSSLVGDVFGWATQQDGRLIHDVLPVREHEFEQLGSGSRELLWWHTEDAFHPLRGDYLALLCLRNPTNAVTTVATVGDLDLADLDVEALRATGFAIRPDESHRPKQNTMSGDDPFRQAAWEAMRKMLETQTRVPVLFGAADQPYLRLDPYFMDEPSDPRAATAFAELVKQLENGLRDVDLQPGDLLLLDNYQAVHGRRPFTARFDGTDRWLKRVNITRDLRKSRTVRRAADDRIVY